MNAALLFGMVPAVQATRSVPTPLECTRSNRRLADAIQARPEFTSVGTPTAFPLSGQDLENGFAVDGYVAPPPEQEPVAALRGVSPAYTAAMGIPLRSGRAFTPADDERGAPVALVNDVSGSAASVVDPARNRSMRADCSGLDECSTRDSPYCCD